MIGDLEIRAFPFTIWLFLKDKTELLREVTSGISCLIGSDSESYRQMTRWIFQEASAM